MLSIMERAVVFYFLKLIWLRKTTLFIFLFVSFCLGLFARLGYQQFIYLQAQNISGLSVFNEIILPLAGLTLACQILISLLVSAQLTPSFYVSGQASLIQQSSLKKEKLVVSLVLPILLISLWPLINFCGISFLLIIYSDIDFLRLALVVVGLLLINGVSSLIILAACIKAKSFLLALLQSVFVIVFLLIIELSVSYFQINGMSSFAWKGVFLPFLEAREGLLVYSDILSYFAWLVLLFNFLCLVSFNQIKADNKYYLIKSSIAILVLLTAGLVPGQVDLSREKRNSVSTELAYQLTDEQKKLEVTAVINKQTHRDEIIRGFKIIQQLFPESELSFQSLQSLGPDFKGAGEHIKFKMGTLTQTVTYPFEHEVKQVFESAIQQMLKRKSYWITFIEGHDEASIFAKTTSDLGGFYKILTDMGWSIASQNLIDIPLISDNTGLLVIASSKNQWLASEEEIVVNYLKKGGNLLILSDPESFVPSRIESFVGISNYPGTLVDWNGYQSGTPHPAVVIVNNMGQHPIVRNINSFLAFPWANGLKVSLNPLDPDVFFEPIIYSHRNVWNEFDIAGEQLVYEEQKGELQQSFVLAMSRYNVQNGQKIVVIGDSHFVSDSAINNSSNKEFGLNVIDWLSKEERGSNKKYQPIKRNKDNYINPTPLGHLLFSWLFFVITPLIIFSFWLILFYQRNQKFK